MREHILKSTHDCIAAVSQLQTDAAISFMERVAVAMAECFDGGGKVLIAGNGGSLCDATHFAEELTGLFRYQRPALPAIALADPGHITCTANDMGFEWIFARAIEAYGQPEDLFIALTTSGNSPNIIKAIETARNKGLKTIAFLGKSGGKLKGMAHEEWIVSGFETSDRVQEAHMAAIHIIIEMVELKLFAPTLAEERS
jgi:D-sedoheptulose 7-phosphate isomerase